MNSICLSAAPNLRCEGLTRTENIVLLVPPAIELIFSITLALASPSDRGSKHWLLVLDGVFFLILALLDFLSHIITQASSTLVIFKIIDFVLAAASFLPILVYTLFLFLFARTNLVTFLPSRFRRVIGFALFAIIPFTIAFNELGSLLGISHGVALSEQKPILVIGFSDANLQRIALFFSSTTLALLTLFQFVVFSLAFIRLVRGVLEERRVEADNGGSDAPAEVHLFRGLGWLAGGLKLGAIESIVGFVNISFGTVLTRRVLRLFSRGALIIGVIKGMNIVEDFVRFEFDMRARRNNSGRMSKRISRLFISNPRNSTFREMSPQASSFHAAQREKRAGRHGPSPLALGAESAHTSFDPGGRKERVTVIYDGKTPPVLQMRFSYLDIPDIPVPALPAPVALPTITEVAETPRDAVNPFGSGHLLGRHSRDSVFHVAGDGSSRSLPISSARTPSVASDSLEAMRELTSRFPGLPPRIVPGKSRLAPPEPAVDPDAEWRSMARSRSLQRRYENQAAAAAAAPSTSDISPVNSIKRKPAPRPATPLEPEGRPPSLDMDRVHEHEQEPEYASVLAQSPVSLGSSDRDSYYSNHTTPGLTRVSSLDTAPTTPGLGVYAERPLGRLANRVIAMEDKMAETRQADIEERQRRRLTRLRRDLRVPDEDGSDVEMELPWMQNDPLSALQTPPSGRHYPLAPSDVDDVEGALDNAWRSAGLSRIKSVSTVRVHTTPVAEQTPELRASLFAVEEEDIGLPESYEAPSTLAESPMRHTRLDSGVLGEEDKRLVRQGFYV